MSFRELLNKGPFFLDGGMGTLLQAQGLKPGEAPETWNLTHPDQITAIHRAYYEAGTNMVATNTFGVHPQRYDRDTCEKMIRAAVKDGSLPAVWAGNRALVSWQTFENWRQGNKVDEQ